MNLLHLEFLATGSWPYRYPLAYGPEGETLEGRKKAMGGTGGVVNKRGSMPTLLNVTKWIQPVQICGPKHYDALPAALGKMSTSMPR